MNATSPSSVAARDDRRDRVEQRSSTPACATPATTTNRPAKNSEQRPVDERERARGRPRARRPCSAAAAHRGAGERHAGEREPREQRERGERPSRSSARSIAGRGGERSASGPVGSSRRNSHASSAAFATRHATPTGSVSARYCAKPIVPCAAAPTIMFCGLPLKLTTPPTFAARREREQVRQRRQPRLDDDRDDERREHDAHRVVDEQRRQRAGDEHQPEQQRARRARAGEHEVRGEPEELRLGRYAAITSTPNSSDDDVEIDRVRARRPSAARRRPPSRPRRPARRAGRSSPRTCSCRLAMTR